MRQAVVGMLAHVDAGKTTLAEAMLFAAGAIRRRGRVDHGDAHLDTDAMERERGITIFSKQTSLDYNDVHLMLLDAPGHVDFSAEAERTLMALDYAVLVIGANDGVQGHTETLWELLGRYGIPAFIFINKLDLAGTERAAVTDELARRLDAACLSGEELLGGGAACEDAAATDEAPAPEPEPTPEPEPAPAASHYYECDYFYVDVPDNWVRDGANPTEEAPSWTVEGPVGFGSGVMGYHFSYDGGYNYAGDYVLAGGADVLIDGFRGTTYVGTTSDGHEVWLNEVSSGFFWRDGYFEGGFYYYYPDGATDPDYAVITLK